MESLHFKGNWREYFKIWALNNALILLTLGLYYPWAKVRKLRYLYANTTLHDRNFEYHATGKQLFLGHLISLVLFIVYYILDQISPTASIVLLSLLFVATPWIVWRSVAFRMRMSSFNNVRFAFLGSLKGSYKTFGLLPAIPIAILFGIGYMAAKGKHLSIDEPLSSILFFLLPVCIVAVIFVSFIVITKEQNSYILNNLFYGQSAFKTDLSTKRLLLLGLKVVLVAITFGGIFALLAHFGSKVAKTFELLFVVAAATTYLVTVGYWKSEFRRYLYSNTKLQGGVGFASTLKAKDYIWVAIGNFFVIAITFGMAYPWAKIRMTKLLVETTQVDAKEGIEHYLDMEQKRHSPLGEQLGDMFDIDFDIG